MDDTREAALAARDIDEMTDAITKLGQEIEQITQNIKDMEAQTEQIKEELKEAADLRKKENLEWQTSNKEDEEAAETVLSARDVLANFYKDNKLVFVQKAAAPEVVAGEAPPPPPATWEGDYGGATGESQGIVSVLDMIHEDILKDRSKAKAEEDDAQTKFD